MSNPQIQAWMKQHPKIKTGSDLEQFYELKLLNILGDQDTSYMCWEEIFDNGVKILPDTVVNVWKGGSWQTVMAAVTKAGYKSVLSGKNAHVVGLVLCSYFSITWLVLFFPMRSTGEQRPASGCLIY